MENFEEDQKAVEFPPPSSLIPDVIASFNMPANVDMLTSAVCKCICVVAKCKQIFPINEQIEWAINNDWVSP